MVQFRAILKRLVEHEVEFVVIGGVAVSLLAAPLGTLDVDVCAPLDDVNLERIINALRGLNPRWWMRPDKIFPVDNVERFRGFKNLYIGTDWGRLDVLGELPGVGTYAEISSKTVEINLGEFTVRVLDEETLLAAKRAAGRDKDQLAIRHLEAAIKRRKKNPGGT